VLRLRKRGYTYPEIVNNFKDRGIRSRRNREYYKNLLVNMIWEYRRKIKRESIKTYNIKNIKILIKNWYKKTQLLDDVTFNISNFFIFPYGSKELPGWNFHKYLINRNGELLHSVSAHVSPTSKEFINNIVASLK